MTKRVGTVKFDRADLDLFGATSHDCNPLHLSDAYARRTPYGERVVYGILGAISALAIGSDRPKFALSSVNITFRHPLFAGVDYRVEADEPAAEACRIRIFDGQRLMMNAALAFDSDLIH